MCMKSQMRSAALVVAAGLAANAFGQTAQPTYDEGVPYPRYATPQEKAWMAENPILLPEGPYTIPVGPLTAPGEYAPADGIIQAYEYWESSSAFATLQRTMIREITSTGQGKSYVVFDTASEQSGQLPGILSYPGVVAANVVPLVRPTDTIWLRDYGPRYTYEGNVRVISDHTYNILSRTNDNNMPPAFATLKRHAIYTMPLVHGGGNYHLNSVGQGFATQLIVNENPGLGTNGVINMWLQHWGPQTIITQQFPFSVDGTGHIDMWMQIVGDNKVILSDFLNNPGTTQDNICETWATRMAAGDLDGNGVPESTPWQVYRTPARNLSGTHYTYTNMVMCNNLAMIPLYTNATISPWNSQALTAYQNALGPSYNVVQVNCDVIVPLAGVMHCIVMHVPRHLGETVAGGQAPTAYLRAPNGSPTSEYLPGQTMSINWIADDDIQVASADLHLSLDNGESFPIVITLNKADTGQASRTFTWNVPDVFTEAGKVRVLVRDADGRTGFDVSDQTFKILGTPPPCAADFNGDDGVDDLDIVAFFEAFEAGEPEADVNGDDGIDDLDIAFFFDLFEQGC